MEEEEVTFRFHFTSHKEIDHISVFNQFFEFVFVKCLYFMVGFLVFGFNSQRLAMESLDSRPKEEGVGVGVGVGVGGESSDGLPPLV